MTLIIFSGIKEQTHGLILLEKMETTKCLPRTQSHLESLEELITSSKSELITFMDGESIQMKLGSMPQMFLHNLMLS